MKTAKDKALKLVKKKITFAGSVNETGAPNIKAMLVSKREGLKTFYFASNISSLRTAQYKRNPEACIYFYSGLFYKGVMLEGIMEVLTDERHRKMIWKRSMKNVYKNGGLNDPDYCVLKFTAQRGRYYYMFETETFEIDD